MSVMIYVYYLMNSTVLQITQWDTVIIIPILKVKWQAYRLSNVPTITLLVSI